MRLRVAFGMKKIQIGGQLGLLGLCCLSVAALYMIAGSNTQCQCALFTLSIQGGKELISDSLRYSMMLIGASLAILGLLYSIWAGMKDDTDYLQIIFKHSYFYPILWLILSNIVMLFVLNSIQVLHIQINDDAFIRMAVLGAYSFIVTVILIGFIYYKIYAIVSTDFLLVSYKAELITLLDSVSRAQDQDMTEESNNLLGSYRKKARRLESRFLKAVGEYDTAKIIDTSEIYESLCEKVRPNRLYDDICVLLLRGFESAVNNQNWGAAIEIISFRYRLVRQSVKNSNNGLLSNLSGIISSLYTDSLTVDKFRQHIADVLILRLRESWQLKQFLIKKEQRAHNERDVASYEILARGFDRLIRTAIVKGDFKSLEIIINGYNVLADDGNFDRILFDIAFSQMLPNAGLNVVSFGGLSDAISRSIRDVELQKIHCRLLQSWMLKNYASSRLALSQETILTIFKFYRNPSDRVEIHANDYLVEIYLTLSTWLYSQEASDLENWDEVISPGLDWNFSFSESSSSWSLWSVVVFFLSKKEQYDLSMLHMFLAEDSLTFLLNNVSSISDSIANQFSRWNEILDCESPEILATRISWLKDFFYSLSRTQRHLTDLNIVNTPLSPEKVKTFVEECGQQWVTHSIIRSIFTQIGNFVDLEPKTLAHPNDRLSLQFFPNIPFKRSFLEVGNPIPYYLAVGTEFSRASDSSFLRQILNERTILEYQSLLIAFDSLIQIIDDANSTADVLIISHDLWVSNMFEITRNSDFVSNFEAGGIVNLFGRYKNVPVIKLFSREFQNRILVADWSTAFSMKRTVRSEWNNRELEVIVEPITPAEAVQYLLSHPVYTLQETGENLTEDEAIVRIQTGVNVKLHQHSKFEILTPSAFEIATIIRIDNEPPQVEREMEIAESLVTVVGE